VNRVRVKICGVRSLEEARVAVEAGADALGFNFWPKSPRYVAPEAARDVIAAMTPLVSCVGVFVNEQAARIRELCASLGLGAVQLHGDELPEFCEQLDSLRLIKAFKVGPEFDLSSIRSYPVNAILLDTSVKGSYGGTGKSFDWRVAIEAKRYGPVILAGGLNESNVADAIERVQPMAIDVCSGVEAEPGRKDLDKLRRFMGAVARANDSIAQWIV
jgi:phosphoribosylanthranilate isomerase